jgi:hypothetical protein
MPPGRLSPRAWIWIAVAAVVVAAAAVVVPRALPRAKPAEPQAVRWSPIDQRGAGMCLDASCAEFLLWGSVKDELERQVLPALSEIPAGSAAKLIDDQGRRDWIIAVVTAEGGMVAHVWLGADPTRNWVNDGRVRIGTPMAPVGIFGTFQRYSDGTYRRVDVK